MITRDRPVHNDLFGLLFIVHLLLLSLHLPTSEGRNTDRLRLEKESVNRHEDS